VSCVISNPAKDFARGRKYDRVAPTGTGKVAGMTECIRLKKDSRRLTQAGVCIASDHVMFFIASGPFHETKFRLEP
jgi:hypothetical protein